jgi:hypothetical protein
VKLYFLVPLTITARCDPRRIFECPAKLFASAFAQRQHSFTRTALDRAAKPAPRSKHWKLARFYPGHSLCLNRKAFLLNQFLERQLGFTLAAIGELTREVFFSIQFSECQFGFTLAAISELTREVFLPDQSAAHTKSSNKCWQALFQKNSVEICAYLWKKIFAKNEWNHPLLTLRRCSFIFLLDIRIN